MLPNDVINLNWDEVTDFEMTYDGTTYEVEHEYSYSEDSNGNADSSES